MGRFESLAVMTTYPAHPSGWPSSNALAPELGAAVAPPPALPCEFVPWLVHHINAAV